MTSRFVGGVQSNVGSPVGGGGGTNDPAARAQAAAALAASTALQGTDIASAVLTGAQGDQLTVTRTDSSTFDIDLSSLNTGGGTAAATTFDNVTAALAGNPTNVHGAITALDAGVDALNAAAATQDAQIAALQAQGHDGAPQDAAIAALVAEQTAQDTAIAARELLANKATSVRATPAANNTVYPSEKAVRDALDAIPTATPMTGADGTNPGTGGTVPAPAAADNVRFLRGDGTWADSPDQVMTGADGTNPGTQGDVPLPAAADNLKFLRGDATWQAVPAGFLGAFADDASLPAVTAADDGKSAYAGDTIGTGTQGNPQIRAGFRKVVAGAWAVESVEASLAYVDQRDPFNAAIGWIKEAGSLAELGARQFSVDAVTLTRWATADHAVQSFSHAAKSPATFQYYDRNGVVNTGFDTSDVSAPQNTIEQGVGWDNNGTLADIAAVGGDTNDGGNYFIYMIPQTGDVAVLLPQRIESTVNNAFIRLEDQLNQLVMPGALSDAVLLGVVTLDENAGNFTFSLSTGRFGSPAGLSAASDKTFAITATAATRDALTAAEMTEGGIVGVLNDDGLGNYSEYRILTLGADFTSSTVEKTFPPIAWADARDLTLPLAADNKPVHGQPRRVTADTTLDLSDVPATAGLNYILMVDPGVVLTVPGAAGVITNTGTNPEPVALESTGVAATVKRIGANIPDDGIDAALAWDTDTEYVGAGNVQFSLVVPITSANGDYVTADGQRLTTGRRYNFVYAADRTAADSVAAIADDPASVAEFALMNLIGEVPGPAGRLERETLNVTGNTFTVSPDRWSWLSAVGVVNGDTVTLPIFASWPGFAAEQSGIIQNNTEFDLPFSMNGNQFTGTIEGVTKLQRGETFVWRQTGPTHITGRFMPGRGAVSTYTGLQRIGTQYRPAELNVVDSQVVMGLDLTRPTGILILQFTDEAGGEAGRPWPRAEIDLEEIRENNGAYIWSHDNAYLVMTVNDLATGDVTFKDFVRGARFISAEIVDFAENGFAIPIGYEAGAPRTISLTGGLGTIAGAATATVRELLTTVLQLDLNPGQAIAMVSIDVGEVDIANPITGHVMVTAGNVDATITVTETPHDSAVVQAVAHEVTGLNLNVANPVTDIDLGIILQEGDLLEISHRYSSDSESATLLMRAEAGTTKRQAPYPSTNEVFGVTFPAVLSSLVDMNTPSSGNVNSTVTGWRIWRVGPIGYAAPLATELVTPRSLVVTSPAATPDIVIIEEKVDRYFVNVTPGQQLVLGAVTDATITLGPAPEGSLQTIMAQATGPNPTVTFAESPVPGPVVVTGADLLDGTWTPLAGGLELHQGTGGDDRPHIRFPAGSANGGRRNLVQHSWYRVDAASPNTSYDISSNNLAANVTWSLRPVGYNLGSNYVQFIELSDQITNEKWEIRYEMDAAQLNAVMDYNYYPPVHAVTVWP